MANFELSQPVDCSKPVDAAHLAGKTAVVTGGASGLGQAYVRALVAANAHVCFGDVDASEGQKLAAELKGTRFVQCDVTRWEDQVRFFETAAAFSPTGKIHYVVANAGVARKDEVFQFDSDGNGPQKPDLGIVEINLKGTLYTTKLAMHYFIKQNGTEPSSSQEDTCLVLIGSGASHFDVPRGPQYSSTKWAMRGIMHSMRRTTHFYGSRINMISPWYVRTKILSEEAFQHVQDSGVEFAEVEDAGQCLLRILSDSSINGRSLFIAARKWSPSGYLDLDMDGLPNCGLLREIQEDQMRSAPVGAGLFLGQKFQMTK